MITSGANQGDNQAVAYVEGVIESWRANGDPNAKLALDARKDLKIPERLVLDLVYEEFCLRHDRGENPDASTFCDQFPTLSNSIKDMLDVHETLESDEIAETFVPPPVRWPIPGDEFRGYQIQRCLGSGALAQVYLANNDELGERHVALKVSRDLKEAATAGRLDHPNVMDVNWVAEDPERNATWMCMPYCGSATLRQVIDGAFTGNPPERAHVILDIADGPHATEIRKPDKSLVEGDYVEGCLHIGASLADALKHAHERGILHRDLKPTNVLITVSGVPKLLDFNLSSDPNVDVHRSGGTLGYMAPEHINQVFGFASGDSHVDSRSEVFALGVILYELMTGCLPYGRPEMTDGPWVAATEMLETQSAGEPTPPSVINPQVSPDVEEIILRCLKLNPCERFETAGELKEALLASRDVRRNKQVDALTKQKHFAQYLAGVLVMLVAFGVFKARNDATRWDLEKKQVAAAEAAKRGDYPAAQKVLESFAPDELSHADRELLAYMYLLGNDRNDRNKALLIYQELDRRYPGNSTYLTNLSYCYSGTPKMGRHYANLALEIDPDCEEALRNKSIAMMRLANNDQFRSVPAHAYECAAKALENDESVTYVQFAAAMFASQAGMNQECFKHAERAVAYGQVPEYFSRESLKILTPEQWEQLQSMKPGQMTDRPEQYIIAPAHAPALAQRGV